ncbi:D-alanyl-D-alanine carboxypeptidase/D-alanyl-D-alanine-endopeptidase [Pedobacter sp. SYSU D00535]|uniref:D-alanyl-D-alanine carboxypeptidase/D-alanyl-D-alanine endopeptidase n=1 Tax=Pedobacter sp. SYSU D00535 TaxID=2810308 RepID=UPI001A969669|nr:D-alanyl-D-alanine carboxypeptidase/D-alanyl-D-alanine-endopeptidase [Pedobacter sp. SYSU D00535]
MKHTLLLLFVAFSQLLVAQTLQKKIAVAYSVLENDPQLKYGLSSLTVLNAETGEVIFSKSGSVGLAPASTLKTVTSIAAFNILGKDYVWETTLGYNGAVENGTLKGDLILTGGGDPTLGSDRYAQSKAEVLLTRWVTAITQAGIKRVEGRVVVEDLLFGTQTIPQGWIWQDIGNYYGAGATSASWRENEFGVRFKAGAKVGEPTQLTSTQPNISNVKILNEVSTGRPGSGDNVYAYSSPYSDIIYVRGTYGIDLNKTIMLSIPDPASLLAEELKGKLTAAGVTVAGVATTTRKLSAEGKAIPAPSKILNTYSSPTLSQVIYWLNQKSLNLYAENILKTIALKQGRKASFQEGVEAVKLYLSKKTGVDEASMSILDGSGLSPENRITTMTLARILRSARNEPWYNSFYESLPSNNNMKMKSGSIRNALCYAGYEKSSAGIPLTFSIITNNYEGSTSAIKQKIFKVLDSLK